MMNIKYKHDNTMTIKRQEWHTRIDSQSLGMGHATKTDDFFEKFQTAFDPPLPAFSENHIAYFFWNSWPKYRL